MAFVLHAEQYYCRLLDFRLISKIAIRSPRGTIKRLMIHRFLVTLLLPLPPAPVYVQELPNLSKPSIISCEIFIFGLDIDLHLHVKWKVVARKRFVLAIFVFHAALSSVKVPILISSAAEEGSRD